MSDLWWWTQVYLEVPNGEKIAQALHSKVDAIKKLYNCIHVLLIGAIETLTSAIKEHALLMFLYLLTY